MSGIGVRSGNSETQEAVSWNPRALEARGSSLAELGLARKTRKPDQPGPGNRLYRRWGIKTAREYARIKINGLRLVGGNPDFTPTRPGTATTTHASTTGSKLTYTLAGDSSPVTPP